MAKWLRRSEYHHALNLSRRARRRGDIAAAERWLKHADRHLLAAERKQAFLDAGRLSDARLEAARARESAERAKAASTQLPRCYDLEAMAEAGAREMWEREQAAFEGAGIRLTVYG